MVEYRYHPACVFSWAILGGKYMKCPNCQRDIPHNDAKFCTYCGTPLPVQEQPTQPPQQQNAPFTDMQSVPGEAIPQPDALPEGTNPHSGETGTPPTADPQGFPQQNYYNGQPNGMPPQPQWQQPWQPPQKKKVPGWLIALIIVGVAAFLTVIISIAMLLLSSTKDVIMDSSQEVSVSEPSVELEPYEDTVQGDFLGISYTYPGTWTEETRSGENVQYASESPMALIDFSFIPWGFGPLQENKDLLESLFTFAGDGFAMNSMADSTVNGQYAVCAQYTFMVDKINLQAVAYIFQYEDGIVWISLNKEKGESSQELSSQFDNMIASLSWDASTGGTLVDEDTEASFTDPSEIGWYPEGMYLAGTDIAPGLYYFRTLPDNFGYFAISSDASDEIDSIIANDTVATFTFLEVKEGEYLEVSGGEITPADQINPIQPENGFYGPGTYRIGVDLPAGEYTLEALEDSAYYAISSRADGTLDSIVTNNIFDTTETVTVKEGEFLSIDRCQIKAD